MKTENQVNKLDAEIVGVRQEAGHSFVVYADKSFREVGSWKAALEALKRGEIERNLLGIGSR